MARAHLNRWNRYFLTALLAGLLAASFADGCSKKKSTPTLPGAHPAAWMDTASSDFHGRVVWATGAQSCAECHGADWRGGKVGVSCVDCHLASGTACIRCHGGLDNTTGAPPYGLSGDMDDTSQAIGAHTVHLEGDALSDGTPCRSCHRVPGFVLDTLHLEPGGGTDSAAEVTWSGLADSLGGAAWDRAARTCSDTYCHGNFSGGDSTNVPGWNDGAAVCGSCHSAGVDPASLGWRHEYHILWASLNCADCHARVVDTLDQIIALNLHVDGQVDTLTRDSTICAPCHGAGPIVCITCHGGTDNNTGAPPTGLSGETATNSRAVGAHSTHVQDGAFADAFDCNECHVKPTSLLSPFHLDADSVAEIIWGGITAGHGTTYDTATATCSDAYCHGNFTGGHATNAPVWTGSNQAPCGSCHDAGTDPASLLWKHEYHVGAIGLKCGDCHASVVDTLLTITGLTRHVNGVVDTLTRDPSVCAVCHGPAPGSCIGCHGATDNLTGAPPVGLRGETQTTDRAVGAHSAHVQDGTVADAFDCIECHVKPAAMLDAGHLGADSVAEIVWGGIAPAAGATWNGGTESCASTYCHGNFTGGIAANAPVWTGIDQAVCGSCHRVAHFPEDLLWKHEYHVRSIGLACADCHASVVDLTLTITGLDLHVNGVVDTLTRDPSICAACHGPAPSSCVGCHGNGDNATGAPPTGLDGESATTDVVVGAHSKHVQGGAQADAFDCIDCHIKPSSLFDVGHLGADSVAEITWGGIAPALGANWDSPTATCSQTYCHGNFTGGLASNAPVWTASSQAVCGSCHEVAANPASLGWKHEYHVGSIGLECADCHASVVDLGLSIVGKVLHVNGVADTLTRDPAVCDACHGPAPASCVTCHGGRDNATGAPPAGLLGQTATTDRAVGAHSTHVMTGTLADAFDCIECHVKPATLLDPGHLGADSVAEVVWGGIAPATNATWHPGSTTCSDTYCHGNFLGGEGANLPDWTATNQATCGSCHDDGTNPQRLSGRHSKHVNGEGIACRRCHAGTVDASDAIIGFDLHVNGTKDVVFSTGSGTWDGTTCNPGSGCHGNKRWY